MLNRYIKWLALLGGAALIASTVLADDKALLDTLVKKGILTDDEAQQIQAEVAKTAVKTTSTPSTIVSGKMYIDASYIEAKNDSGSKIDPSGVGIDVKRFYFGVTHKFDDMWLANINTDSAFSSSTGTVSTFIKTAYVQAKLAPEAIVQVGSANEPWIPWVEDLYGFRYVENTLIDRLHFGNSADWGVHLSGSHSILSYSVAAVNGGGYKNPTRTKNVDFEGRVSVEPIKGLIFGVGGYDGKLGKDTYASPAARTASRYDVLGAYVTSQFRVGAEYFSEDNFGVTGKGTSSDKADGWAVWGSVKLADPFTLFARYDNDKPSKTLHPSEKEWYSNVGLEYTAIKGVNLALVYKHDNIDNPASALAKSDEIGVFSQIAF